VGGGEKKQSRDKAGHTHLKPKRGIRQAQTKPRLGRRENRGAKASKGDGQKVDGRARWGRGKGYGKEKVGARVGSKKTAKAVG